MRFQPKYLRDLDLSETQSLLFRRLLDMDHLNILLIGSTATGKTTLLDILLREYYTGCTDEKIETNVLRISSLKEQGLQFFRQEIKTFCQTYSSIPGRKKCVVVDDVDQVHDQSQQVFRNFMDKYSKRVHFLASCSNPQKVVENLHSRFFCVGLTPVPESFLKQLLDRACGEDQLKIDESAKEFLVQLANRSVRVLLNLLEKIHLANVDPVTLEIVQELCCDISEQALTALVTDLLRQDLPSACARLLSWTDKGFSVIDILDDFYAFLKHTPLLSEHQKHALVPCVCKYIAIFNNIHEDDLELIFFANQLQRLLLSSSSSASASLVEN